MIEKEHINFEFITRYVRGLVKDDIKSLYDFAHNKDIPVAKPETTKLLHILSLTKKPKKILELGTGIGCSAIILSKASEDSKIITVEKNPDNYKEALDLIELNKLSDRITVINDDGINVLKKLSAKKEKFDFIFLDSAKAQYIDYYPYLTEMLDNGGMLITDNVLYGGMVATDELLENRKKTIVKRLRMYIDALNSDKTLQTVVVPIGDGVSISIKR